MKVLEPFARLARRILARALRSVRDEQRRTEAEVQQLRVRISALEQARGDADAAARDTANAALASIVALARDVVRLHALVAQMDALRPELVREGRLQEVVTQAVAARRRIALKIEKEAELGSAHRSFVDREVTRNGDRIRVLGARLDAGERVLDVTVQLALALSSIEHPHEEARALIDTRANELKRLLAALLAQQNGRR